MKKAFTLAEVLITLGIIGIVAAMTLPNLVAKHRLKVLHTQFLKTYSDLNNAAKRFEVNNGITVYEHSLNGNSPSDTLKNFMSVFIGKKFSNGSVSSDYDDSTNGNLAYKKVIGYTPKSLSGAEPKIQPCDKSIVTEEMGGRFFALDDGVTAYTPTPVRGPKICVDINGRKGPNIYGYDWFVFIFTKDGAVKPYIGNNAFTIAADMPNPEAACDYKYSNATYTCAYFALTDTSPVDPSKTYWTDFLK